MKKLLGIALASAAAGLCLSALKKASDEQTVELSPIKRSSPNKKAILVVSFGTSYAQTREKTIGAIRRTSAAPSRNTPSAVPSPAK